MNQGSLLNSLRRGIFQGLILWGVSCHGHYSEAQQVDLNKRDLYYLEHLKQELAKAESMPGGLEYARQIKRQIQTIEKGTTVYTPELMGFKSSPPKTVSQTQPAPHPADSPAMAKAAPPLCNQSGVVSLTGGGKGGHDIDLFHDKTITVGQDYGISEDAVRAHMKNTREEKEIENLYKPLEMPGEASGEMTGMESVPQQGAAMQSPLYGLPVQKMSQHGSVSTAMPSPRAEPHQTVVDAPQFHQGQQPQQLYGNPSVVPVAGMSPYNSVIPSLMQTQQNPVGWKGDKSEVEYLDEQLKTKLSQLAHARRQLSSVTGKEANAWTFRIHNLEAKKQSLLRMMKTLGVTPSFQKVSLKEDSEFDTIQSEEHLLKRQLYKTEKEEKKLKRQMQTAKDPEVITVMGDRLASLENDRKLLEASLRSLEKNSETVDHTAFVAHPAVYRTPQSTSEPAMDEKEEVSTFGNSSLGTVQEQRDRSGHPDYIERVPRLIKNNPVPEITPPSKPTVLPSDVHMQEQGGHKIAHDDEDEETSLQHERKDFWSTGLPSHMDHYRIPVEKPRRVDRKEAHAIAASWNAE